MTQSTLFPPGCRVLTHLGEIGIVTKESCHLPARSRYVQIEGAVDTQIPPRWEGELIEVYDVKELTLLQLNP